MTCSSLTFAGRLSRGRTSEKRHISPMNVGPAVHCEAGALRGRARDYAAATLRNLALDDENMVAIAQMDAVAPLVAQA